MRLAFWFIISPLYIMLVDEPPSRFAALTAPKSSITSRTSARLAPMLLDCLPSIVSRSIAPSAR